MPTRTRRRTVEPTPKRRPPTSEPRSSTRRRPGALTALLVVVAAGAVVAAVLSLKSSPAALVSERTVTVTKGVIQTVVSGSGNLAPAKQVDVDFATSGTITKIYTKAGAHVSKGELLARIDNRSQKVDVAKAQATLVDAQDALTKAQDAEASGSTVADTSGSGAAAGTTLVAYSAQETPTATPTDTPAGGTPTPTPTPTTTPRGGKPSPTATATPQASATPSPTATAPSGTGGGARGSSGGASSGSGGSDSSSSGGATGGGSTQSVESAQAGVDSAQLALEDAQDALDDTVLRAPMAGTVASISSEVGDTAGSGSTGAGADGQTGTGSTASSGFIVLAALSKLKLEVGLSESDIGKVEVGQSATITINAASGEKVAGHVTDVGVLASDSSSGSSSAVSYPVTITLDQSTDGVKAGMSATADIVVARADGISVPSQALRGSTVTVERDGKRSTVRVQSGVVGDSSTQVLSGLEVGDKVIVTSTSALSGRTATGTGAQQATGRFGGGLGGAGGGFGGAGGGAVRAAGGGGFGGGPGGP